MIPATTSEPTNREHEKKKPAYLLLLRTLGDPVPLKMNKVLETSCQQITEDGTNLHVDVGKAWKPREGNTKQD
jgi:hypothetical protein